LDKYHAKISPLTEGEIGDEFRPINGEFVEGQLGGMLTELQTMSKSLSSLKALQEVDFSQTSDQIKTMGNFYDRMNAAMKELSASVEDTKVVRTNLAALNENLNAVNMIYRSVAESKSHVDKVNESMKELSGTAEEAANYKTQMASLNQNMRSLNGVYGNVLSAMTGGSK
jgi:DNA repair ATPase RecN